MVGKLGHQHLGQQPGSGNAFVNDVSLYRSLGKGLAFELTPESWTVNV